MLLLLLFLPERGDDCAPAHPVPTIPSKDRVHTNVLFTISNTQKTDTDTANLNFLILHAELPTNQPHYTSALSLKRQLHANCCLL